MHGHSLSVCIMGSVKCNISGFNEVFNRTSAHSHSVSNLYFTPDYVLPSLTPIHLTLQVSLY